MTKPGPHGEPWGVNDLGLQWCIATADGFVVCTADTNELDEGELSEGRRAWSHIVACVNAMHAAGVTRPEELPEFIRTMKLIVSRHGHDGLCGCRNDFEEALTALREEPDAT